MEKPDWSNITDRADRRKARQAYARWREASDLPNHAGSIAKLPEPAVHIRYRNRIVDRGDDKRLTVLQFELEAARKKLDERAKAEPPEELLKHKHDGETLEEFRQRMRRERANMHSRLMGSREGVGTFTEADKTWLAYLETVDWLGR